MMSDWTEQEVRAAFEEIVKRAEASAEFRARAIDDAAGVLSEVSGKQLPSCVSMQFVELENGELGVQMQAKSSSGELSDEELEQVAGGIWNVFREVGLTCFTGVQAVSNGTTAALKAFRGQYPTLY